MPVDSPGEARTLVALKNLTVTGNGSAIIEDVSLTVRENEIVTLVGPNGAGKSTLIRTTLGLLEPSAGTVEKPPGLRIGYVPQSVHTDATLPISVDRFLRLGNPGSPQDAAPLLEKVGCAGIGTSPMDGISGGELRRVLLARALMSSPDLLILDEPTSGVDVSGQAALYNLVKDIRDELGCGVLLVSHNLHIVMAATDRVVCLNRHLCCSGTPEDVRNHPEFMSLFGGEAQSIGIYRHHHDHEHDIHGEIHRH